MVVFRRFTGNDEKYYNLSECQPGLLLVEGAYLGSRVGKKFGNTEYEFRDLATEKTVVLSGGHLGHLIEKSRLKSGGLCRVYFAGDQVLEKGRFKGKMTHTFELEVAEAALTEPKAPSDEKAPWDVSDDDLRV